MSFRNNWQLITIAGAFILFIILTFAPRVPEIDEEAQLDSKVKEAVDLVQNSPRPMEGILKLREVLEEDPDNKDAIWYLGSFSMKSGQYDKAITRFEKLLSLLNEDDSQQVKVGVYASLSEAYFNTGEIERSLYYLEEIKKESDDPELISDIDKRIKEINSINKKD